MIADIPVQKPPYVEERYVDFVFMRHGETLWNEKRLLQTPHGEVMGPVAQGSTNIPLNEKGREQAHEVAEFIYQNGFAFKKALCSPLDRALETATIVASRNKLDLQSHAAFSALSWGINEGRSPTYRSEVYGFDSYGNYRGTDWHELTTHDRWKCQPIPKAETPWSVMVRMDRAMQEIARDCTSGDQLLIISHSENMKGFILYCLEDEIEEARLKGDLAKVQALEMPQGLKNCSLLRFRLNLDRGQFRYLGELKSKAGSAS